MSDYSDMPDYTQMTDAELMRIAQQDAEPEPLVAKALRFGEQSEPAPKKEPPKKESKNPFDGMTDIEVEAIASGIYDVPKRKPRFVPQETPLKEPAPPAQQGQPWDLLALPRAMIGGAADAIGSAMPQDMKNYVSRVNQEQQLLSAAPMEEQVKTKLRAMLAGGLNLADAAVNLGSYVPQRITEALTGGVAKPIISDMSGAYRSSPMGAGQYAQKYPNLFGWMEGASQMGYPLPLGTLGEAKGLLGKLPGKMLPKEIAADALTGAGYGTAFAAGEQIKKNKLDLNELGLAMGGGALMGGGLSAMLRPAVKGLQIAGERMSGRPRPRLVTEEVAGQVLPAPEGELAALTPAEQSEYTMLREFAAKNKNKKWQQALDDFKAEHGLDLEITPQILRQRERLVRDIEKYPQIQSLKDQLAELDAKYGFNKQQPPQQPVSESSLQRMVAEPQARKGQADPDLWLDEEPVIPRPVPQQAEVVQPQRLEDISALFSSEDAAAKAGRMVAEPQARGGNAVHDLWWNEEPGIPRPAPQQDSVLAGATYHGTPTNTAQSTTDVMAPAGPPAVRTADQILDSLALEGERLVGSVPKDGSAIQGEMRWLRDPNAGRKEVSNVGPDGVEKSGQGIPLSTIADHGHLNPAAKEITEAVNEILRVKTDKDYLTRFIQSLGKHLYEAFPEHVKTVEGGDRVLQAHGVSVPRTLRQVPDIVGDDLLRLKRNEIADQLGKKDTQSADYLNTMLSKDADEFVRGIPDLTGKDINSPEAKAAFELLAKLHKKLNQTQKIYDGLKQAPGKNNPAGKYYDLLKSASHSHLDATGKHLAIDADVDVHHLDPVTGEFVRPLPGQAAERTIKGQLEYSQGKKGFNLTPEGNAKYEDAKKLILDEHSYIEDRIGAIKKLKVAAPVAVAYIAAGMPAHAAGPSAQLTLSLLENPVTPVVMAAAGVKLAGPAVGKLVREHLPTQLLFNDVMDFVGRSDKILDQAIKADKSGMLKRLGLNTNFASDIWLNYLGRVLRETFGVRFKNPLDRQMGIALLRNNKYTPSEALKRPAGTAFENMTDEQLKAVLTYDGVQTDLRDAVTAQLDGLKAAFDAGLLKQEGTLKYAYDALKHIERATGPHEYKGTLDKLAAQAMSNFMEYNFFWNIEHHAANLTDSWIAGGTRAGVSNIARAHQLLATDRELMAAFGHSNLLGHNTSDRVHLSADLAISQGKTKPGWGLSDIPSDQWNSDRVALAAFLQYAQQNMKRPEFRAQFKSDVDFVKALVGAKGTGKLTGEDAIKAWGHMAELASRTLGVDPYRINMDMISTMHHSPVIGLFLRQPARMSRLMLERLENGDVKGLLTLFGTAAVLGGSAAMPQDVRAFWSQFDARAIFSTAALLDDMDPDHQNPFTLAHYTNSPLSNKLQLAVLYPFAAATSPIGHGIGDIISTAKQAGDVTKESQIFDRMFARMSKDERTDLIAKTLDAWRYVNEHDGRVKRFLPKLAGAYARFGRAAGQMVMPKILRTVPTRDVVKGLQVTKQIRQGEIPVYPQTLIPEQARRPADHINIRRQGIPPEVMYWDQFIPGMNSYEWAAKMKEEEKNAYDNPFRADFKKYAKDTAYTDTKRHVGNSPLAEWIGGKRK